MRRLEGKTALVTGAARGIGEAIAKAFVREGAFVYVTDIDLDRGPRVAMELAGGAAWQALDVREESHWQQALERVAADSRSLDIVVNNAGITGFEGGPLAHDPENASLEDWRAVHRTNLDGVFLGCKYAIRAMKEKGVGSIVNVSSRSGLVGIPAAAAYASSKAAVRNHTKSVALYCAGKGWRIRCNSLHPAAILTPMWEPVLGPPGPEREARMQAFTADCPLRRFGTVEEVAAVALLLASDETPYVTGAEFVIDGGILAGSAATP